MFDRLVHADWSCDPLKKWMASAERASKAWRVDAPQLAPQGADLADLVRNWSRGDCTLLFGFDFPIGLPVAFGKQTGFRDFRDALSNFGEGQWKNFFKVAENRNEMSLTRPFYPQRAQRGRRQTDLFTPLGVTAIVELLRRCERKTPQRRAAARFFGRLEAIR